MDPRDPQRTADRLREEKALLEEKLNQLVAEREARREAASARGPSVRGFMWRLLAPPAGLALLIAVANGIYRVAQHLGVTEPNAALLAGFGVLAFCAGSIYAIGYWVWGR